MKLSGTISPVQGQAAQVWLVPEQVRMADSLECLAQERVRAADSLASLAWE